MTMQDELDDDFKCILSAHLLTRRDLLKRVKAELMGLKFLVHETRMVLPLEEVASLMDRLIAEAAMPGGTK